MPAPIAICLEDLDSSSPDGRYLRCVAMVGRQPGLRLGAAGEVRWQDERDGVCELWVSADNRLILLRTGARVHVSVSRAGRCVVPACDKPVVLLDGDELEVGGRRVRLHVHGPAPQIAAPSPLPVRLREQATRATAVLAMGAAVVGCDKESIEVRDHPPAVPELPAEGGSTTTTTTSAAPDAAASASAAASSSIEVRESPPAAVVAPPSPDQLEPPVKPAQPGKSKSGKPGPR